MTVQKIIRQWLNLTIIPPHNVINQLQHIKEIARYSAHYNNLKLFFNYFEKKFNIEFDFKGKNYEGTA